MMPSPPAARAAAAKPPDHAPPTQRPPTLEPGRTCWRIETATQFSFLVDGEAYFAAVRHALARATRSIFILGWDIDSRMQLMPQGADDGYPAPLGDFLNAIVSERKRLRAYVLTWDFAMLYALEREWLPVYKLDWVTHRRLAFRLDDRHPVGASHHQKIVVVDDDVAFVSGFDLTRCRWDTPEHARHDPRRVDNSGSPYAPFHDVGAVVAGPCARALGELARERWRRATGRRARARTGAASLAAWPQGVAPDLTDVPVGIARTEPAHAGSERVEEIRNLHQAIVTGTKRHLFAENQYFTSRTIAEAFAQRLSAQDAPEIAVLSPYTQSGWLEISTMGVLRGRIHREIRAADTQNRYRLYWPMLPWQTEDDCCLNIHSKVLIADDELLTLGSANLSDRSMALDTECNLVLEARGDPRMQQAIAGFRNRLLAEHLDCEPAAVAATMAREGSLHRTIERLGIPGKRRLEVAEPTLDPALDALIPDHRVLDPEQPLDPDLIIDDLAPENDGTRTGIKTRLVVAAVVVIGFAALALAWRTTGLREWLDVDTLVGFAAGFEDSPFAPLFVALAYVVGALMVMPLLLLIAATAVVFGPALGTLYALCGALLGGAVTYGLGRKLGRETVRRLAGPRLNALSHKLARRGLLAVVLVRIVPIAPFTIVNIVAGASHIGWRDFLLGTLIGVLPGTLMTNLFVDRAVDAARHPGAGTFALLGAVAVLIIAIGWFLRRKLDRGTAAAVKVPAVHVG